MWLRKRLPFREKDGCAKEKIIAEKTEIPAVFKINCKCRVCGRSPTTLGGSGQVQGAGTGPEDAKGLVGTSDAVITPASLPSLPLARCCGASGCGQVPARLVSLPKVTLQALSAGAGALAPQAELRKHLCPSRWS